MQPRKLCRVSAAVSKRDALHCRTCSHTWFRMVGPIENVPRSTFGDGNASFAANHEHCSQTSNFKQVQVQHPFPDTATWVFLLWPSMPRTPKKKVRFSKGSFEFVVYIGLGAGLGSRAYNFL